MAELALLHATQQVSCPHQRVALFEHRQHARGQRMVGIELPYPPERARALAPAEAAKSIGSEGATEDQPRPAEEAPDQRAVAAAKPK